MSHDYQACFLVVGPGCQVWSVLRDNNNKLYSSASSFWGVENLEPNLVIADFGFCLILSFDIRQVI